MTITELKYSKTDGCIVVPLAYDESYSSIIDFITSILKITKDEITFTFNEIEKDNSITIVLYHKIGTTHKEIGRIINRHDIPDNTCYLIRGFAKKRFLKYLETCNIPHEEMPI